MSLKDPAAKKKLDDFMIEYAPLVQKHINILKSQGKIPPSIQDEDLHFAGFHGLIDALHKYDPEVGARLSTKEGENPFAKYAERRIQGKMLDHIVSHSEIPKSKLVQAKNLSMLPKQAPVMPEQPSVAPEPTQPAIKPTKID